MADNELELYDNVSEEHDVSDEHNNESLHEDYILVTKPQTISKVWVHFSLTAIRIRTEFFTQWRLRSQNAATATRLS